MARSRVSSYRSQLVQVYASYILSIESRLWHHSDTCSDSEDASSATGSWGGFLIELTTFLVAVDWTVKRSIKRSQRKAVPLYVHTNLTRHVTRRPAHKF